MSKINGDRPSSASDEFAVPPQEDEGSAAAERGLLDAGDVGRVCVCVCCVSVSVVVSASELVSVVALLDQFKTYSPVREERP